MHAPVVALHTPVGQSVACVAIAHARHAPDIVLHAGVSPEQLALLTQPTHEFAVLLPLQTPPPPGHVVPAAMAVCWHAPALHESVVHAMLSLQSVAERQPSVVMMISPSNPPSPTSV